MSVDEPVPGSAEAGGPSLELQLLGGFAAVVDGQAVPASRWERSSARSLVQLLALSEAGTLHREQVMEALWPRMPPSRAANHLDKAIHAARRALEPGLTRGPDSRFVLTRRHQITLAAPGALRVDVLLFERAAYEAYRHADPQPALAALALHRGELLAGEPAGAWSEARRQSLRQLVKTTAVGAARQLARRREPELAVDIVKPLAAAEPADESLQRLLMWLNALRAHRFEADAEVAEALWAAAGPAGTAPLLDIVPVTTKRGPILTARYAPDGGDVVATAQWAADRMGLFRLAMDSGAAESMPPPGAELYAISPQGELALGLAPSFWNTLMQLATLAVVPAAGGEPLVLAEAVQCADWHPSDPDEPPAQRLAIVCQRRQRTCIEYPIGTLRHESDGWISRLRFSPDGRRLAFVEHPIPMDDEGHLVVLDLDPQSHAPGAVRQAAGGFLTIHGLAWLGDQLWFTAARRGSARALHCINASGAEHRVHSDSASLTLHDALPRPRRLLVAAYRANRALCVRHADDAAEREITWHDNTVARGISADGRTLLIEEMGVPGRQGFLSYLRSIDGTGTRLIGHGAPLAMSADLSQVIVRRPAARSGLTLLQVDSGASRALPIDDAQPLLHTEYVSFFPDGRRIAFWANDAAGDARIYLQDLEDGLPRCFTPDEPGLKMLHNDAVCPAGRHIVLNGPDGRLRLYRVDDGSHETLAGLDSAFRLVGWAEGGLELFVRRLYHLPATVFRYRLSDAALQPWRELCPQNAAGVRQILGVRMTPDGRSYAYGFERTSSDLYEFKGV
ncbi:MAG: PD40 domain-containing protein [Rubrivivax sp.]|nr:PD40 domain-containing protein [Rubrivivax sp.]